MGMYVVFATNEGHVEPQSYVEKKGTWGPISCGWTTNIYLSKINSNLIGIHVGFTFLFF